jgi:hypothetical protein
LKPVPTLDLSELFPPPQKARAQAPRLALDVDMSDIDPPPVERESAPRRMGPLEDEWYVHDLGEFLLNGRKGKARRKPVSERYIVSPLQEHSGVQGAGPLSKEDAEELVRRLETVRETMEK